MIEALNQTQELDSSFFWWEMRKTVMRVKIENKHKKTFSREKLFNSFLRRKKKREKQKVWFLRFEQWRSLAKFQTCYLETTLFHKKDYEQFEDEINLRFSRFKTKCTWRKSLFYNISSVNRHFDYCKYHTYLWL